MSGMFGFLDMAGNHADRKVATYEKYGVFVDTCSVTDGTHPYETAVGHPEYNDAKLVIVEAYDTRDEAMSGHNRWVKTMTAKTLPKELRDCQNAEISQLCSPEDLVFPRQIKGRHHAKSK